MFNHIYYPALTTYFDASSTQAVDLACCILYWDNGDGTETFAPLCQYPWRIHAGFWTETPAGPREVRRRLLRSGAGHLSFPVHSDEQRRLRQFRGGRPPSDGDPKWPSTRMPSP